MSADREEYYRGGYSDGAGDALTAVRENPEAVTAIRKFCLNWTDCPTCNGTGKNLNPSAFDVGLALMASLGARSSDDGTSCRACHGERVVPPAPPSPKGA